MNGIRIKKRNPVFVLIFSIITFGLYAIYWAVKTKNEINSLGANIPSAWLLIPMAHFYFWYKYAEGFSTYVKKDNNGILWFLLYLFLSPVAMIIFQVELNKLAEQKQSI